MPQHPGRSLPGSDSAMAEATRLVRAGRLTDATGLIQRTLGGGSGPTASRPAASSTAAPTSPAGAVRTGVHHSPAGKRPYRLFVPSTTASTRPLIVMLHGGTQDGATFARSTRMDALAEQHGLLVAYPEQTTAANPMRYWNWFSDQQATSGEPAIIASLIGELVQSEGADPARTYVAGFSAGAAMAAVLASTHPDLVAAVGIHSGLAAGAAHDVASAFTAMRSPGPAHRLARPVPAITFHGDADPTVSIANSRRLAEQFGLDTAPETERGSVTGGRSFTIERHRHHDSSVLLEQWVVHGMAHAWSGGVAGGSYTDPSGPDAAAEMVRFFQQHQR